MNIIFLDVDGVLNSSAYLKSLGRPSERKTDFVSAQLSDYHLGNLSKIYHTCNAQIVLSSTWRTADSVEYNLCETLAAALRKYDMKIMSKTPVLTQNRPLEIWTWLNNRVDRNTIRFVSLDDDFSKADYEVYGIGSCLVQTRYFCDQIDEGGLQPLHVEQAIHILKQQNDMSEVKS